MARYTGWRRLSGDTADRPDLLDIGKKLLGDLENQRRLSGVKTCYRRFTAVDGSVVTARFDGDIPSIDVQAAKPGQGNAGKELFEGFVTAPRMFGTAAANDGQLAFGDKAQVILQGRDSVPVLWRSGFFDSTYLPEVFSGAAFTYERAFRDGLALAGNIDWTNSDGSIALTWLGPKMRSLSLADPGWSASNLTHRGPCVYCNGAVLVDHSSISATEKIIGACIARFDSGAHLVYVAYQHDFSGAIGNVPKVYAARLGVNGAQLATIAAEDVSLLATGVSVDTEEHLLFPCLFFNQAGTEGRMIRVWVDPNVASNGYSIHFTETVVTLNADGTASIAEVDRGEASPVVVGSENLTVAPNAYSLAETTFVDDNVPDFPVPVGTYEATYSSGYAAPRAITDSNLDRIPDGITNSGSVIYTLTVAGGPFPIAVDYEDDTAVYLYWTPGSVDYNASITASWTQSSTATQSSSVTYAEIPDTAGATYPSADEGAHHLEISANGLTSSTATDTITDGRLHAVDKEGVTWLDIAYSKSATASSSGSADLAQAYDRSYSDTYDSDGTPLTGTDDRSASTHFESTLTTGSSSEEHWPMLWWVDLRSRSASYSLYTHKTQQAATRTSTADAETTTGLTTDPSFPNATPTTSVDETVDSVTLDVDTRVVFYGVEVDAVTMHSFVDAPSDSSPAGSSHAYGPGDVIQHRFSVSAAARLPGMSLDAVPTTLLHGDGSWAGVALSDVVASFDLTGDPPDLTQEYEFPPIDLGAPLLTRDTLDFDPTNATIDQDDSFIYIEPFGSGVSWWIANGADRESTAVPTDIGHHNFGTWIAHKGLWAYSMPDLSDLTHADMSAPQYRFGVKGGASLDTLTGSHSAELFEFFWPLTPYKFIPR